jgi:hypothetical protein
MSEPQLPREVRRRLAIIQHAEEVTGNVAMTCRYYGISRQVYYPVVAPLPGAGRPRVARVCLATTSQSQRHTCRRSRQDSLSTPELPFRAVQDRNVSQAVSRRRGVLVGRLADP